MDDGCLVSSDWSITHADCTLALSNSTACQRRWHECQVTLYVPHFRVHCTFNIPTSIQNVDLTQNWGRCICASLHFLCSFHILHCCCSVECEMSMEMHNLECLVSPHFTNVLIMRFEVSLNVMGINRPLRSWNISSLIIFSYHENHRVQNEVKERIVSCSWLSNITKIVEFWRYLALHDIHQQSLIWHF